MNSTPEPEKNPAAEAVPAKRSLWKRFWRVCRIVIFVLPLILLLLPGVLEHVSNWILNRYLGNSPVCMEIRELGLRRGMVNAVVTFPKEGSFAPGQVMHLGTVGVTYAPLRLLSGTLDSISISNVNLPLALRDGKLEFPLLELFRGAASPAEKTNAEPAPENAPFFSLPLRIRELNLSGSLIYLQDKEFLMIPFTAAVTQSGKRGWANVSYRAQLYLSGTNRLGLSGVADLEKGVVSCRAEGTVRLENLPRIFADRLGTAQKAGGAITLNADGLADLKHSRLEKLDGTLKVEDLDYTWAAYTVQGGGEAKFSWRNGTAEISYDGDLHTDIGSISCALKQFSLRNVLRRGKGVNGSCIVNVGGAPGGDFSGTFILRHNRDGVMEFTLRPHEGKTAAQEIVFNGMKAAFPALKRSENYLKLAFTDDVHVSGLFRFPEIALTAGAFTASMKQFRLELGGTPLALQVGMTLPEFILSAGENVPQLLLGDISLQADLGGTKNGSFAVKRIRCGEHEIGHITGTLQPDMRNGLYGLKAEIETLGIRSTLAASFLQTGRVFDAAFRIPEQNLAKEIDLGTYVPALQSFVLSSATFKADCVYRWTPEGHRGGAKLQLSKVNAVSEEKKFRLSDASLRFTLPNLPELQSGAGQFFRFKALRFDNLNFDSANVLFRMESPTVWQLEGATFNWCGGKIRLGSARIAPATERFSSIMFCDRVRLGALLAQFGIGSDAGDNAALNGTIPVSVRQGRIIFRNGFLYSTPGEKGTLKLVPNATVDALGQSSVEMSFALSALKNFQYDWVKLTMNTENDNLKLKFQVDGRPAAALPFSIDADSGRPVRTQGSNRFQGIPLDVNVTIPLTKTLELYQMFSQMFGKGK